MPVDQRGKPGAAGVVLGAGGNGPAPDIGIGGSGPIRCISAAGGLGHAGGSVVGRVVVEQAHSSQAEARAASGNAGERMAFVLVELVNLRLALGQVMSKGIAAHLCGLQLAGAGLGSQAGGLGMGGSQLGQLGLQRGAPNL